MSLILIRQKARRLRAKKRRQVLGALTAPVAAAFFYAFSIYQLPHLQQVLHALFVLALAWSIAGLYFLKLGEWSGKMRGDAGFSTGLEFCRRELERQRDYFRRILLWSFGPIVLAITTFLAAFLIATGMPTFFSNAMPVMVLAIIWVAAYLLIRAWQQREVQREIDELSEIENENER